MRLEVVHETRIDYGADVVEGVLDTRLGPRIDATQNWQRFDLTVHPTAAIRRYRDSFDNAAHLITVRRPHRSLEIVARSEVVTLLEDPFQLPTSPPLPLAPSERWDYLSESRLVQVSPELRSTAEPSAPSRPDDTFEAVRKLMELVHGSLSYQQNRTDVATTVEEILRQRAGVCQDFAHVLIGLCRSLEIPARYVSGYIVQASPEQPDDSNGSTDRSSSVAPTRGAAASHAWVEAFTPTHGWRGFDPTNNLLASEHHVKMAVGRDYSDVPPTRGTARGSTEESLTVSVTTHILD